MKSKLKQHLTSIKNELGKLEKKKKTKKKAKKSKKPKKKTKKKSTYNSIIDKVWTN